MSASIVAGLSPAGKPHPAVKWSLLMALVMAVFLGVPRTAAATPPSVRAPTGPSSGGYFTGTYNFVTYVDCGGGLVINDSTSGALEGHHTYAFVGAPDGSLLVQIDGGGSQLITSCGDPYGAPQGQVVAYTIARDTVAPNAQITSPADGSQTSQNMAAVVVSATDGTAGVATVAVNGVAASLSGGAWRVNIGLAHGANMLMAVATDGAGHSDTSSVNITYNGSAPPPTPPPQPPASSGGAASGGRGATKTPAATAEPTLAPVAEATPVAPVPAASVSPSTSPTPSPSTLALPTINVPSPPSHPLPWRRWLGVLLVVVSVIGLVVALRRSRWLAHASENVWLSALLWLRPRWFRLRQALKQYGRAYDKPKRRGLSEHHHSGRLLAHHHTSYPALGFLLLVSTVLLTAYSYGSQAESSLLSLTVLGPPPTQGATIEAPLNGAHFTTPTISVSGTCPGGVVVEIYRNTGFAGSAICSVGGLYSLLLSLVDGSNDLMARDLDGLGQYGPDSATITVVYDAPPPPPTPSPTPAPTATPTPILTPTPTSSPIGSKPVVKSPASPSTILPFTVDSARHFYEGGEVGAAIDWVATLRGGQAPYRVVWDWGDGVRTVVEARTVGAINLSHKYSKAGFYSVIIRATDGTGRRAALQVLAIVNGTDATITPTKPSFPSTPNLSLAWPLLLGAALIVASFWLGERHRLAIWFRPQPKYPQLSS